MLRRMKRREINPAVILAKQVCSVSSRYLKQGSIACSLSRSPNHHPDMTKMLWKRM